MQDPQPGRVETATVTTADGLALAAEHHRLPASRGRVVVVHGYAEHKGRYARLVAELAAAGYESHLFDLRGHGDSQGPRGHVASFAEYRDDLERFLAAPPLAASAATGGPLLLLGHSLGGLIVLDFALHRPAAATALALTSPYLAPAFPLPAYAGALVTVGSYLLPAITIPTGLKSAWLSHDPQVTRSYDEDPRVFRTVTPGWMRAVTQAQSEVFARAGEILLPVLLQLGGADPIADPARSRALFARIGSSDKQLAVYPGYFHEVLNELERAPVIADLLAWLDRESGGPGF
ncbi:MAG TPA: alpha/beta hydrolase [Thermoanaerobaculia bacterium]|nr:alpha/beta hydrolase [Thermoanaerobaculia bacterium]